MSRFGAVRIWITLSIVIAAIGAWIRCAPIDPQLLSAKRFRGRTITDRHGVVLHEPLSGQGTRGAWLEGIDTDAPIVKATVAAEDRRFYRHWGVDPMAIARAALRNVSERRIVEGGSTLSQQTAKLLLGSSRRSVSAKVRETVLALRLEHRYSKRAILTLYLNLAPYGNQIAGVERASRIYFGRSSNELTIAQAAYLASLPQRPSAFNPLRNAEVARQRQLAVVGRMREAGFVTEQEASLARSERLRISGPRGGLQAQHFVDRVLERCIDCEASIRTTLDGRLQSEVQGIIAAHRDKLLRHGAHSVAVAVLDHRRGEWLAWEGSGDYFGESFGGAIDGVTALRQPGSTLKPFTYAVAFEQRFSPASVLDDKPSHFATAEEGVVYTPRNYDDRYRGSMRARYALAGSVNVPAVGLLEEIGAETLLRFLRRAGFDSLQRTASHYGLGLTLGDAEVSLESLVRGYAMLARGGVDVVPRFVLDRHTSGAPGQPLLRPRTAFWISDILADGEAREFIFGRGGSLELPFPAAVKTGTSQAYRDNWTIGYTPEVTVGVWVGNFDTTPLRNSSGVTGAAPIFQAVMLAAMKGRSKTEFTAPADLAREPICAESGHRPSLRCANVTTEWIARDAEIEFCDLRHETIESEPDARPRMTRLRIVNPAHGATYMIDPTLRAEFQTLRLKAEATSRVRWQVNERLLGGNEWSLRPGRHTITALDRSGRRDEVTIFVK